MIWILLLVALVCYLYHLGASKTTTRQPPDVKPAPAPRVPPRDQYQQMGEQYEREIGQLLEGNGYLVIYTGLLDGYSDGGVDLIAIDRLNHTILLVQCKNWHRRVLTLDRLELIDHKLTHYSLQLDRFSLGELQQSGACGWDQHQWHALQQIQPQLTNWTVRKVLYIASDKVVDLAIGQHLTMYSNAIFRYGDLKIVTTCNLTSGAA